MESKTTRKRLGKSKKVERMEKKYINGKYDHGKQIRQQKKEERMWKKR